MFLREAAIEDKTFWDEFVTKQSSGSFLQSWTWGDFQATNGNHVKRLIVGEGEEWFLVCLLVEYHLPFGRSYLYSPWGPVKRDGLPDYEYQKALQQIRSAGARDRAFSRIFVRIEPYSTNAESEKKVLEAARYTLIDRGIQPKETLVLDLTKTEDDLLRDMHPKTRYNIRVSIRHGVEVADETGGSGCALFSQMAQEIERKGEFHYHRPAYYQKMLEVLGREKMLQVMVARHKGEPLAAGIFINFNNVCTYAHGASYKKKAHVMAPHLLHWEQMLRAKKTGSRLYDFFGIAPNDNPRHPWAGITRFKKGFGGKTLNFPGAADAVFDPIQYRLIGLGKALKQIFY